MSRGRLRLPAAARRMPRRAAGPEGRRSAPQPLAEPVERVALISLAGRTRFQEVYESEGR